MTIFNLLQSNPVIGPVDLFKGGPIYELIFGRKTPVGTNHRVGYILKEFISRWTYNGLEFFEF